MAAGRPRRGGRIRAAGMTASTADTLDPAKGATSSDYIRQYMFDSLLSQLDRNLVPQPELAERIESADQITWHIKLRKGVTFHDGATLNAHGLHRRSAPGEDRHKHASDSRACTEQKCRAGPAWFRRR
jgi:peptide/nickel transport system substrate-binding protein